MADGYRVYYGDMEAMNAQTIAPFVRIGLRIFGGFMIGKGWVDTETAAMFSTAEVVGAVSLAVAEGWYVAAKHFGWSK